MNILKIIQIIIGSIVFLNTAKSMFFFFRERRAARLVYKSLAGRNDVDSLYRMAILSLLLFKYKQALEKFKRVEEFVITNSYKSKIFENKYLRLNMYYCNNPMLWIKRPRNLSSSYFNHILLRIFGGHYYPFYEGINEDLKLVP